MSTPPWTFLTNHMHVLVCIARDPSTTMREVAGLVGITERAVQRIVRDLEEGGYLVRRREGRRNVYAVQDDRPLRHVVEGGTDLGTLLRVLRAAPTPREPSSAGASSSGEGRRLSRP